MWSAYCMIRTKDRNLREWRKSMHTSKEITGKKSDKPKKKLENNKKSTTAQLLTN